MKFGSGDEGKSMCFGEGMCAVCCGVVEASCGVTKTSSWLNIRGSLWKARVRDEDRRRDSAWAPARALVRDIAWAPARAGCGGLGCWALFRSGQDVEDWAAGLFFGAGRVWRTGLLGSFPEREGRGGLVCWAAGLLLHIPRCRCMNAILLHAALTRFQ